MSKKKNNEEVKEEVKEEKVKKEDLANEKRIDIVKDRSADPSLIYMSSKLDISDQVLRKLGAK